MPDPLLYLKAAVATAVASAVVVLALARWRRGSGESAWLNATCVLGLCAGLTAGCYVLSLQPALPPAKGLDRLFAIVMPAVLLIELMAGFQRLPGWLVSLLRLGFVGAVPRILLHGSVYLGESSGAWTPLQAAATLTTCAAIAAIVWALLAALYERSPGASIPLGLSMVAQATGILVMLAGYLKGGAAAIPLATSLMATALATRTTGRDIARPMLGAGLVGLFGLLLIGRFFGRLSTGCALTLLLTPLLCWVTELPFLQKRKPLLVGSVRLALVAIPLAIALLIGKREFDEQMAPLLSKAAFPSSSDVVTIARPSLR